MIIKINDQNYNIVETSVKWVIEVQAIIDIKYELNKSDYKTIDDVKDYILKNKLL